MADKGGHWLSYKVRTCYSMHECALCRSTIKLGEQYYDGGFERRAHVDCVKGMTFAKIARGDDYRRRSRDAGATVRSPAVCLSRREPPA